jgi:acyl carrier protein
VLQLIQALQHSKKQNKSIIFADIISIMEDLKNFIREEIVNVAFKKVSFDESLIHSKLLDSITMIDLIVSIEEKIGKQIPQHLINDDNFDSIDKIINTINSI